MNYYNDFYHFGKIIGEYQFATSSCYSKKEVNGEVVERVKQNKNPFAVSILGQDVEIQFKSSKEDKYLEENNLAGYHLGYKNIIVIKTNLDYGSQEGNHRCIKEIITHEVIHAFLFHSGLYYDSSSVEHWAVNEEMIDWFAMQGEKIYDVVGLIYKYYTNIVKNGEDI